jgi:hypothetical protein
VNRAVERLDDAATHVQAQARSFAHVLGGDERFEQAVDVLGINAGAGVVDLDLDRVSRTLRADDDLVARGVAGLDRLDGVDQEVEEHLPQLGLVGKDARQAASELANDRRPVAGLALTDPQRSVEARVDVDASALGAGAGVRHAP